MDTLTHGLAGALLSRAFPTGSSRDEDVALQRREAWTGFFAAMFPDADALLSPGSTAFYVTHHRGLSHSFLLIPIWAVALALVAALVPPVAQGDARRRLARLFAISAAGLASHILLDWITSFGTMFLSPWSWARFSLDWVFIVDLYLSGILVASLFWARLPAARGQRAARLGLFAATLYIFFCGLRHRDAMRVAKDLAGPAAARWAAIPQPLSSSRWMLVFPDDTGTRARFVDLDKPAEHGTFAPPSRTQAAQAQPWPGGFGSFLAGLASLYEAPERAPETFTPGANGVFAEKAMSDPAAAPFRRFARFPAAMQTTNADGSIAVTLVDLRFGVVGRRFNRFNFVMRYGADGRLLEAGFP